MVLLSQVHIEYLHAPDRETPFAETCEAINEAYKAGKLEKFGLSNFSPEEVEEVVELCEKNGWVKPTVYQGQYNAIARLGEDALLPMLRKHGLSFYAYRSVDTCWQLNYCGYCEGLADKFHTVHLEEESSPEQ